MTPTPGRTSSRDLRTLLHLGTFGGLTDGQLLERFVTRRGEGAELAFTALVERHGPMVLRVCRGILRDDHEAMDAFQATFLALVRKGGSLWVRDSIGPWLHRVACRAAGRAKAQADRRRALERRAAEAIGDQAGGDDREDRTSALHEELDRLPDRYRVPIVLCDLEGRTCEEAAQHLGRPVGTVKSWRSRGRERLREGLARRGLTGFASLTIPGQISAMPRPALDAVVRVVAGRETAGVVPTAVFTLTEGVLRSMLATKLKLFAAAIVAIGVIAGYAGVFAYQTPTTGSDRSDVGSRSGAAEQGRNEARPAPTFAKVYYVGDLILPTTRPAVGADRPKVDAGPIAVRPMVDVGPIIELITSSVAQGTWEISDERGRAERPARGRPGVVGSITPFYLSVSLIIRHTAEVHDQVAHRLRLLRRLHLMVQPPEAREEEETRLPRNPAVPALPPTAPAPQEDVIERPEVLKERAERIRQLLKDLDREIEALSREKARPAIER